MTAAVVIGSGPAGVAAAHALCDAGLRVTLLDAGGQIEPGRMEVFDALARSEPERWPPELVRRARDSFPVGLTHVPLKPAYGSLFPYALEDPDLPLARVGAETAPSLAYGGLSNAWGASILPYRARDLARWPVALRELAPHYEAVLRFVPIAAERDELAQALPLYTDAPGALRRGAQAETILRHLRHHAPALRAAGFTFGASRLALATSPEDPRRCRHGGLCLHGCPYGAIYNAAHTLEQLVRAGRVEYRGGLYVERLSEVEGAVRIDFHRRGRPAERGRLSAARVFVACGALSSTRLVLESAGHARYSRRLADSQYYVIPLVSARAAPLAPARREVTLAQVFVELEDPRVSAHTVHLQLYGYNDLLLAALARRLLLPAARVERLLAPLLGRVVVAQGYLHSDDSPGLTLTRSEDGLRLVGDDVGPGAARVRRLVRRLAASARPLGLAPLPGLVQVGRPGKGNHLGGSLPMRRRPGPLESDTLGRPRGWERVHVVDAAVFPSLPATTVTLSVMANAHRIAATAAAAEQ
jgi:choline dehydrogenase-like flavoprotein